MKLIEIMASIWRVTSLTADVTFNTPSPSSSVLWAGFGPPNSPPYTCRRVKSLGSDEVDGFSEFFVSYLPVFVSSFFGKLTAQILTENIKLGQVTGPHK